MFGRCEPDKVPVLSLWLMVIGNPLCRFMIGANTQPPRIALPTPLVAHFLPVPNGSSTIGAKMNRCGTSIRL